MFFGPTLREAPSARCCLCSRKKADVRFLVVGLIGAVCEDCTALCVRILGDKIGNPAGPYQRLSGKLELLPTEPAPDQLTVDINKDIAEIFPDEASVNNALQPLANLIRAEVALHSKEALAQLAEEPDENQP